MRRAEAMQAAAAPSKRPIAAQDMVVTTRATSLQRGATRLATVPAGADLQVLKVQDNWVAVVYRRDSQELVGWIPHASVAARRIVLQIRSQVLAQAVAGVDWSTAVIASGGSHLAYCVKLDEGYQVIWNGKRGEPFDVIEPGQPLMSSDGRRMVYGARRGDQWYVVIDNVVRGPFESLGCGSPTMNSDGSLIVYVVGQHGRQQVMVNQQEVGLYDELLSGTPFLSPDGKHYAFAARDASSWRVFVDGREIGTFDELSDDDLLFRSAGSQFACVGRRGNRMVVTLDGKVRAQHDEARYPYFMPGSGQLCYQAGDQDGWCIVVESQRTGFFDDVGDYVLGSQPNDIAFWARTQGQWQVVHHGNRGPYFASYGHGSLVVSPDSQRVAYVGVRDDKAYVVVDEQEHGPYEGVLAGTPVFGSDSQNVAYLALEQGTWQLYLNDRKIRSYADTPLEFSVRFTPDGRLPLSMLRRDDLLALNIGDAVSDEAYYFPRGGELRPVAANRFQILAARGQELLRVEAEISPRR